MCITCGVRLIGRFKFTGGIVLLQQVGYFLEFCSFLWQYVKMVVGVTGLPGPHVQSPVE